MTYFDEEFEGTLTIGGISVGATLVVYLYHGEVPISASIKLEGENCGILCNLYRDQAIRKLADELLAQRAADKSAEMQEAEENGI